MSWNIKTPGDYINGPLTVAGSATITGDLTVDTSTLKVDSTNHRVGIVTATPLFPLDVSGSGVTGFPIRLISASGTSIRFDTGRNFGGVNRNWIVGCDEVGESIFAIVPSTAVGGSTFTNPVYKVNPLGVHTFGDGAGGTRMTLDSTGLNVASKVAINGAALTYDLNVRASTSNVGNTAFLFEQSNGTPLFTIRDNGTILVAGDIRPGNTVNTVSPTSPNRTITMIVNGVTLYIPAKTTND
jgi:hypothetical protein